ncbi:MAG: hypothetical protein LW832_08640 [Parachlamydia sp.]|jgi:hypothetical protein|nr:hypothetical protein [Parachlamydia sp.]
MSNQYKPPVNVELELSAEQYELVKQAADRQGKSVKTFLKDSLSKKTQKKAELSGSKINFAKFKVLQEYNDLLKRLGEK